MLNYSLPALTEQQHMQLTSYKKRNQQDQRRCGASLPPHLDYFFNLRLWKISFFLLLFILITSSIFRFAQETDNILKYLQQNGINREILDLWKCFWVQNSWTKKTLNTIFLVLFRPGPSYDTCLTVGCKHYAPLENTLWYTPRKLEEQGMSSWEEQSSIMKQ
jgi:hypothetical protein